jgi:hypothetical protein
MREDFAMIEGEYLRDLLHQPLALENTLTSLATSKPLQGIAARLNKGKFQRVVRPQRPNLIGTPHRSGGKDSQRHRGKKPRPLVCEEGCHTFGENRLPHRSCVFL